MVKDWKAVLWRERQYSNDRQYAKHLYYAVTDLPFHWLHWLIAGRRARPHAHEVEAALRRACQVEWGGKHAWRKRLRRLDQIKEKAVPIERFVAELQSFYWLKRFIARHTLLYRGNEAVEVLVPLAQESSPLQKTARWLLQSISADTTARLADMAHWACSQCLTRCASHPIRLNWQPDLTFYGCRICRRSWGMLSCPQGIVAVLDNDWPEKYELHENVLHGNWLKHRSVFDFDYIEIVRATDEEVERFAVQVGNDTDPVRKPRYEQMICLISSENQLAENTVRILKSIFGEVRQESNS